jgi:hypothetical protein
MLSVVPDEEASMSDELLERLGDGKWHTWGDLAQIAEGDLGREAILANDLRRLVAEGRVAHHDPYEYAINHRAAERA